MRFIQRIGLALLCSILVSCFQWGGSKENSRFIEQAYLLVDLMPDSALMMLDSINTVLLNKKEKAAYSLLRLMAKDNAGLDVSSELEIFQLQEYFVKIKDWEKAALACFYSGKVAVLMGKVSLEIDYYQEGLEYAKKANDELLQGKILFNMGFRKFDRAWYSDKITQYQQAFIIYQTPSTDYQHDVYLFISIGNLFISEQKIDSARHYFNAALDIAKLNNDNAMQALTYNQMMESFIEVKLLDTAKYFGRQALNWTTTDREKANIYKNFAQIYIDENIIDSARFYIVKAEPFFVNFDNLYELANFYFTWYEIEKAVGNLSKALEYFELYTQYRLELTNRSDFHKLLDFQKKYEMSAKERNYYKGKRGIWRVVSIFALVALLLTYGIISMRYKTIILKKMLSVFKKENEEASIKLQDQQTLYKKRNIEIQTLFLEKLGFIKEITILNTKNISPINISLEINAIKSKMTTQKFIEITNELYPGFTGKLKNAFPDINFSEREISICCLILYGFSNQELALFLYKKKDTSSIQKVKTRLRKKLDIPNYGNIQSFLLEKIVQIE